MKPIGQHIKESDLNELIAWWNGTTNDLLIKALLELKQRRAEDRQRENDGK
jgi:hypothetical protein